MAAQSDSDVDDLVQKVVARLKIGGGGTTLGGGLGFECSAVFTCGDYVCTTTHACPNNFGCTIKFAGLARF